MPRRGEERAWLKRPKRQPRFAGPGALQAGAPTRTRRFQLFWRRFRQDRLAIASLGFIGLLIVVAIAAPLIVEIAGTPPPDERDTSALDIFGTPTGPSSRPPVRRRRRSAATSSAARSTAPGSR